MTLAIMMSLPLLELLMDEYITERGDADDNQLLRQLVLSDFIEWVNQRQRQETTDEKCNLNEGATAAKAAIRELKH